MIISTYISCAKIQLVSKKVGTKLENRKYLVSGLWCQSRGPFWDCVSFQKKSQRVLFELSYVSFYLVYTTTPLSVIFCGKKCNML